MNILFIVLRLLMHTDPLYDYSLFFSDIALAVCTVAVRWWYNLMTTVTVPMAMPIST